MCDSDPDPEHREGSDPDSEPQPMHPRRDQAGEHRSSPNETQLGHPQQTRPSPRKGTASPQNTPEG